MPAGQLTSEIIETILDLMIAIPHLKTIAAKVEVCARTLRCWLKSGNDGVRVRRLIRVSICITISLARRISMRTRSEIGGSPGLFGCAYRTAEP